MKDHSKVSLERSLLLPKPFHLSQLVFIRDVLQATDHLHGSPTCVGTPELDTALHVGSHEGRGERQSPLPLPDAHTALIQPRI